LTKMESTNSLYHRARSKWLVQYKGRDNNNELMDVGLGG
jgi:hypothetical protein